MGAGWIKALAVPVVAAGYLGLAGECLAQAGSDTETFTITANTVEALAVACTEPLEFGTLAVIASGNAQATVSVAASPGASAATSAQNDVFIAAPGSPAVCSVTGETGANATAILSGGGGTWDPGTATLSNVRLSNGVNTLTASLVLSAARNIGVGALYIGGSVTIPANHQDYGTYSETITLTVTD